MQSISLLHSIAIYEVSGDKDAPNFRLTQWPPEPDFPVVIDKIGNLVSRYSDSTWDLSPWARSTMCINFFDDNSSRRNRLSSANGQVLRKLAAWWIWGPTPARCATTLKTRFNRILTLVSACNDQGICADSLWRYPLVLQAIISSRAKPFSKDILSLLHILHEQRDDLGFMILDRDGLRQLAEAVDDPERRQSAYIPPRIWTYQASRTLEFLNEFNEATPQITSLYRHCISLYSEQATLASTGDRYQLNSPFSSRNRTLYKGSFSELAKHHGALDILKKWVIPDDVNMDSAGHSIASLSTLFSMVTRASLAYVLTFSGMRIAEAWSLRIGCLEREIDPKFGSFYYLKGVTTKTIQDSDARWIVAPTVKIAVDAAEFVSRLRIDAALSYSSDAINDLYLENPFLFSAAYEPWSCGNRKFKDAESRPIYPSFLEVVGCYPKLFDSEALKCTAEDITLAKTVNPSLNLNYHKCGSPWPLSWHQLRRTLAVNMFSSGLVSDSSIQYQLKHSSRAMSLYYGRGHARLSLNKEASDLYISATYEALARSLPNLLTDRFSSHHGDARKLEVLHLVDDDDEQKLKALLKKGRFYWRRTLLGGCTKNGPCEYGGIDNIVRCGGGDGKPPCIDALFDSEMLPSLINLETSIASQVASCDTASPLHGSLSFQLRSVKNVITIINRRK